MQTSVLIELESMVEFGILITDGKEYEIQVRSSGFDIHLPLFSTIKLLFPQLIPVRINKLHPATATIMLFDLDIMKNVIMIMKQLFLYNIAIKKTMAPSHFSYF